MSIAAGSLNTPIEIQQRSETKNALNESEFVWTKYADDWADFKAASGLSAAKQYQEGVIATGIYSSFRVRYRTDLTVQHRIVARGVTFDIIGVSPDYAGQNFTDIICRQGANNG